MPDPEHVGLAVDAIAGLGPLRFEQTLLLVVAQHPYARAGADAELADLHVALLTTLTGWTTLTLTSV